MFEIAVRAEDDRSDVAYFLDVGTVPGGKDVMDQHTLGGPKTSVDEASFNNMLVSSIQRIDFYYKVFKILLHHQNCMPK